jgi:hypothetical protein
MSLPHYNEDEIDFYNMDDGEEPTNLLEQIAQRGHERYMVANRRFHNTNLSNKIEDLAIYGHQNNARYSMENFITETLGLNMRETRQMGSSERTDYIIDKAVEAINGDKIEIHFTPYEDTNYKKIKLIYDKLVQDLKKMICIRLKISPCPSDHGIIFIVAQNRYPDIQFDTGMKVGYKLKVIEDYLETKAKTYAKGVKKTRQKLRRVSKKRDINKQISSGKSKSKSKRRRTQE